MLFPSLTVWLAAVVQVYEQAPPVGAVLLDDAIIDLEPEYPAGFPQEFEAG